MNAVILLLAFLCVISLIYAEISLDGGVLVLDEDNFDEALEANDHGILVEFYAPWCGHCKQLAPEWSKAALSLAKTDSPIKLAKVDATEAKNLASKFEIRGFPTIKFFRGGKSSDYQGGRTEADIVAWVNKKSSPVTTLVATEADLLAFQEKNSVFVLGIFSGSDSPAVAAFTALALADESLSYAVSHADDIKAKFGVSGDTVIVVKDFDELRADMSVETFDADAVKLFISGQSVPLVQEFSQEGAKKIFASPITKHTLFFTDKAAAHHESTIATVKAVAAAFRGKSLFVNVPATETRILDFFGITPADLPTLVFADMGSESGLKKYPLAGDLTVESITAHLNAYFAGALKPFLKSEKVAPEDTTGPVVVLKGESFADLVINNKKDVMVEFYAPWCGHCKKLAPIWDDLGSEFENNSNVVIAKMDATANEIDVPGVNVKGFPTIYYFPGNDKANPVKYEGGRELDDFISFLQSTSTASSAEASTSAGDDEL